MDPEGRGATGSGWGRLGRRLPQDGESRSLCAAWEDGARGELGCEELPWSQPFRCPEREFGDDRICPAKVEGSVPQENQGCHGCSRWQLRAVQWVLDTVLGGEGKWPLALLFILPRRPASFLGRDSWLGRSGGQTQRRSPFPSWSVASFPGLAIFIPDVAAEGAGVG